jgi:hypothetical protein
MLAFILALALPPVLLSFALADDFRDAVVRATIGMVIAVGLLAAVTLADVAPDEPTSQTTLITFSGY